MRSQSAAAQSPGRVGRAEPGAASREPGWGRGRSAAERERARPSPSPAAAGPRAMEQDNSPRKIQFTVPLLEPHLDPEAAEQVRAGRGSGTRRRTRDRAGEPESLPRPAARHRTPSGTYSPSLRGSPSPPPTAKPRLPIIAGPCAGYLRERRSLLPCLGDATPPPRATLRPLTFSQPPEFPGWVSALTKGYRREGAQGRGLGEREETAPPLRLICTWALSVTPKGMRTAMEELWREGGGLQADVCSLLPVGARGSWV